MIIFREDPGNGKREVIKANLGEAMSGNAIDVPIKANDIVVVPKRPD